ncbi:MAG: cation diffusion facilitator family transporter [Candidatus Thermoplasmatota archaeon]|nr:cation diffusion facilitator family transporter [Candidatus Thermoplasmatota archaeon]
MDEDRAARRITLAGGFVNLVLTSLQAVGGVIFGSVALLADALHSLTDLVSDAVVYIAVRLGAAEADENHPYGHRRFETLASLAVGLLIVVIGVMLVLEAAERLQSQMWVSPEQPALVVAGITIFAKEGLYRATMRVARKYDHALLRANAVHHRTDALSSIAVFIGLFASMYGFSSGDLIAALVVGLLLIRAGLRIVWEAGLELSEAGVDAETYTTMRELILDTGGVEDLHLLKTKTVGGRIFAEAHVQVRPTLSVTQGHEIAHRAVDRVMEAIPLLQDLTVHVDPEDDQEDAPPLPNGHEIERAVPGAWVEATGEAPQDLTLHLLVEATTVVLVCSSNLDEDAIERGKAAVLAANHVNGVQVLSPR